MAAVQLRDLKTIRETLEKSQSEMAGLLGISVRAVQSYEQGWREVPAYVQQMVGLLMFLQWRREGNKNTPCWKVRGCTPQSRSGCAVYQFRAGDLCWMMPGTRCTDNLDATAEEKLACCEQCPVMQKWLTA